MSLMDRYELRIGGHLDQRWTAWFDGMTLTHEHDGTTTLRGDVHDQAALHGLIAKIRDIGVTLISITAINAPTRGSCRATTPPVERGPDDTP